MTKTKLKERLEKLAMVAKQEFAEILKQEPTIGETTLRLYLVDNSFMEIRYPREDKYSFHWQKGRTSVRINTAPHHPEIHSSPRHLHENEKVIAEEVTDLKLPAEENFRRFLNFVKRKIKC